MRSQVNPRTWIVTFLLGLFLFALYAVDWLNLSLQPVVRTATLTLVLIALLDATAVSYLVRTSAAAGWRLVGVTTLFFYALKTFLVAVEAVYLTDVLTLTTTLTLLLNGLVTALLFVIVAVWAHGRFSQEAQHVPVHVSRGIFSWLWRLLAVSLLWVVLFVVVGLLVFQPLGTALDAAATTAYLAAFQPESPELILLFQVARAFLWILLTLPAIWYLPGSRGKIALVTGLSFAILMGTNLLQPNELLPGAIQVAHTVEVAVENFLFGILLVWLVVPRVQQTRVIEENETNRAVASLHL